MIDSRVKRERGIVHGMYASGKRPLRSKEDDMESEPREDSLSATESDGAKRPLLKPQRDESGKIIVTPEMRELAHALTHPEGDPYLNGRELGFYCEQCG